MTSLISIYLYLNKLSSCYQMITAFISSNHTIKLLFEYYLTSDSILYYLLLDKVTFKQRLKIKSSIIDTNNYLNSILLFFNFLHKELSSDFYLVDTF